MAPNKKSMPSGSNKAQTNITPRNPMNASQSGAKKSGGVFARLTNRKMSNYESQLKKKFGAKHSDSQSAFGQRKQSANIK